MSPPAATAADAVTARGPQSPPRAVAGPAGIGGIGDGSASGGSASGGGTDCGDTDSGGAAPQVVPTALTPSDVAALLSRPRLEGPDEAVPAVVAEARVADKVTAAASRPDRGGNTAEPGFAPPGDEFAPDDGWAGEEGWANDDGWAADDDGGGDDDEGGGITGLVGDLWDSFSED